MSEVDNSPEPRKEKEAPEVCLMVTRTDVASLLEDVSSFNRLKRIKVWMNRFIQNCHAHRTNHIPWTGPLTMSELTVAEEHWIITVQGSMFPDEGATLQKGRKLSCSSKLLPLHPFLD